MSNGDRGRYDPTHPYADESGYVKGYASSFPGQGVAGNAAGAVGDFFSSGGIGGRSRRERITGAVNSRGQTYQDMVEETRRGANAPSTGGGNLRAPGAPGRISPGTSAFPGLLAPSRTNNVAGETNGGRSSTGTNATPRASMPSVLPKAQNLTGRPSVITTKAQQEALPVTPHNQALARERAGLNPVITTKAQQQALPVTPHNQALARERAGLNPVISTRAQQEALPVTANRQRVADVKAAVRPLSEAQDPYNWAGIARDLGNAGDVRWASAKTGALPSTGARAFVAQNIEHATPATRRKMQAQAGAAATPRSERSIGSASTVPSTRRPTSTSAPSTRPPRMTQAQSIAKRRENAAPYKASLNRRASTAKTTANTPNRNNRANQPR